MIDCSENSIHLNIQHDVQNRITILRMTPHNRERYVQVKFEKLEEIGTVPIERMNCDPGPHGGS